jgi:hypothetical protein
MWGSKMGIEPIFERLLKLPVLAVLAVMWIAGLAMLVTLGMAFYLCVSALAGMLLGA